MKRVVLSVLSLIIIIVMVLSLVPFSYFSRPDRFHTDVIKGYYSENENTMDAVYIGGSACFVYWEPLRAWNEHGFTSYNFACTYITPQAIKNYIIETQKTQKPDLYILDVRPFQYADRPFSDNDETAVMYHEANIRHSTDSLKYSMNRIDLINRSVKNPKDRIEYYIDLFKYHRNIVANFFNLAINGNLKTENFSYASDNPLKGFYFLHGIQPETFTDYSNVSTKTPLSSDAEDILIDLLDYCKENELQVLFVVHSYCQQEEHKQKYNYMQDIVEQYGYLFLNTNDYWEEIGLDYSLDMYNEDHVNVFGAEKYTDFLAEYITQHYKLPDHRSDLSYSEWDRLYLEFEDSSAIAKESILGAGEKTNEE